MVVYIKLLPGGKLTNGLVNGPAEIYDSIGMWIKKGYFVKSKLNDPNGVLIKYNTPDYILFQLNGSFTNNAANGEMTRIVYDGPESFDSILANNSTIDAIQQQCTYFNGNLMSIDSSISVEANITYTKHPTQDYFTNFTINIL